MLFFFFNEAVPPFSCFKKWYMGAHIKKIRVLKALVLVVLVMVVSPKWRLCVFANAEEEVGSKSSDDTTTTTATKDDGEKRRIFGGIFSSWFWRDKNKLVLLRSSESAESGVKD